MAREVDLGAVVAKFSFTLDSSGNLYLVKEDEGMAKILIGNVKGPKGDTGARGATGPQGPVGPQPPLTNNALTTQAGISALDAVMGKTLGDQITQLNSDLDNYITIDSARIGDWMVLQKRSGVISVTIRTVRPNGGLVADKLVILPDTIPVGFRPQDVTYAYCKLLQGNNISMWGTLLFQFYPDGLIKFVSSQNVNVDIEIDGSTSWITG